SSFTVSWSGLRHLSDLSKTKISGLLTLILWLAFRAAAWYCRRPPSGIICWMKKHLMPSITGRTIPTQPQDHTNTFGVMLCLSNFRKRIATLYPAVWDGLVIIATIISAMIRRDGHRVPLRMPV